MSSPKDGSLQAPWSATGMRRSLSSCTKTRRRRGSLVSKYLKVWAVPALDCFRNVSSWRNWPVATRVLRSRSAYRRACVVVICCIMGRMSRKKAVFLLSRRAPSAHGRSPSGWPAVTRRLSSARRGGKGTLLSSTAQKCSSPKAWISRAWSSLRAPRRGRTASAHF